ncbi:shikimate kinase AroK [Exilibacterium tricleocarpae]|uniref:Shikimate kinase n=1 Tax=Exilibacterium tricleocarpae TaxID=2591008 RepID=A0A545T660_9GAMM|nr:shikimate kinase AroK [Exilibacterium tricleocarpae]TQV72652.1 shikimate kinase AroK [Exilibacterium tricleocarpae]
MKTGNNIILVGPMGAGKSTIGRVLAAQLNLPFEDSDRVIETRTGADIPWIFDVEGEQGFRQRESAVLRELVQAQGLVLATGGGIVMREENRRCLNSGGQVVYLTASIEQLLERTYKDRKRPLLQVDDPKQKIIELIELRDPLYREVADYIVNTDKRSPKSVAHEIAGLVG